MTRHEFGGGWTQQKLDILRDYVYFFTTALKNRNFTLHYADAFAGTGAQDVKTSDSQGNLLESHHFEGSARVALSSKYSFDKYHFNDLSQDHCSALQEIAEKTPSLDISISNLDANEFVKRFCASLTSNDRAVLFIDPYSTELDWGTLSYVADSNRIDLWLLFPLSALLRMTPRDGLKPEWVSTVTKLLGTDEWISALYKDKEEPLIEDLFGDAAPSEGIERLNVQGVSDFVRERLAGQFSFVAEPVTLYGNRGPLFLFFFAVSNPSKTAIGLAKKVSSQIISKRRSRR